jgi:ABC-type nitrate/sulfonate/bicarbonate transport system, ATPase component
MPLLQLKNLEKHYGDQVVLERLNMQVERGEFVAIVGASGCGKTTFLNMLLGTEAPTKGELLLDGAPIPDEPDAHRGVVFQRYSVFPHLTVLGNVMLATSSAAHAGWDASGDANVRRFASARRQCWRRSDWNRRRANIRISCRAACSNVWPWRRR